MRSKILMTVALAALAAACSKPKEDTSAPDSAATADTQVAEETAVSESKSVTEPSFDASAAIAGVYATDPNHAYITFSYDHQGYSKPWLRWRNWRGELNWNPSAPEQSSVTAVIDASSADSGVDRFDEHLESADFFDAAAYPEITFKSTSVAVSGSGSGTVTGDLTIKGATKPVTLDVTINRAADDGFSKSYKLGFSAKGMVKRSDFGVDKYTPFVGDDVTVVIEAEFVMPKEAPVE